ncbi:PaaI family thioesterase [Cohnella sp. REN36]|uniref:PaaI family thioesterase n=1 Tax=Cohnella sp. REN36 TaxID=2887347 RepID=UPI001D1405F0|nr:hypothetical protein [Cohnella sp. REN36]MCC3375664.1 hypothetical protein [Cohnella sp. REN36]
MTILEHYRKVLNGELEQSPVERLMGLKLLSVEEGEATYEMQASEQHANPQGTCNGGIIGFSRASTAHPDCVREKPAPAAPAAHGCAAFFLSGSPLS